jgi:hypothetical protein
MEAGWTSTRTRSSSSFWWGDGGPLRSTSSLPRVTRRAHDADHPTGPRRRDDARRPIGPGAAPPPRTGRSPTDAEGRLTQRQVRVAVLGRRRGPAGPHRPVEVDPVRSRPGKARSTIPAAAPPAPAGRCPRCGPRRRASPRSPPGGTARYPVFSTSSMLLPTEATPPNPAMPASVRGELSPERHRPRSPSGSPSGQLPGATVP